MVIFHTYLRFFGVNWGISHPNFARCRGGSRWRADRYHVHTMGFPRVFCPKKSIEIGANDNNSHGVWCPKNSEKRNPCFLEFSSCLAGFSTFLNTWWYAEVCWNFNNGVQPKPLPAFQRRLGGRPQVSCRDFRREVCWKSKKSGRFSRNLIPDFTSWPVNTQIFSQMCSGNATSL